MTSCTHVRVPTAFNVQGEADRPFEICSDHKELDSPKPTADPTYLDHIDFDRNVVNCLKCLNVVALVGVGKLSTVKVGCAISYFVCKLQCTHSIFWKTVLNYRQSCPGYAKM